LGGQIQQTREIKETELLEVGTKGKTLKKD